jgi:RNA polymerase sigma-70 factor (ECF subfamily)
MADRPTDSALGECSDEALIPKLCAGDESAYVALIGRYHARLLRLSRSFVRTQASAEEVVQETWLAVLQGIDRFEQRSSFKVWLFQILTNRAKTLGQREGRTTPFSSLDADDLQQPPELLASFRADGHWKSPPPAWDEASPEVLLLRRETRQAMEAAIQVLPPVQRAVLIMRDLEGLDAESVCSLLQISESNQRVLLHRARTQVRLLLEKHLRKT